MSLVERRDPEGWRQKSVRKNGKSEGVSKQIEYSDWNDLNFNKFLFLLFSIWNYCQDVWRWVERDKLIVSRSKKCRSNSIQFAAILYYLFNPLIEKLKMYYGRLNHWIVWIKFQYTSTQLVGILVSTNSDCPHFNLSHFVTLHLLNHN